MAGIQSHEKPLALYGIKNTKYAIHMPDGQVQVVKEMAKAKSLQLTPVANTQDVFANDQKVISIITDQGYTGTLGTTGQDVAFELEIGHLSEQTDKGILVSQIVQAVRFDLYHEYTIMLASGLAVTIKQWIFGLDASRPNIQYDTNTDTITIGAYQYPSTIYGRTIMDETTPTQAWRDKNGFEQKAWRIFVFPDSPSFNDFEKTVPVPIMPTIVVAP